MNSLYSLLTPAASTGERLCIGTVSVCPSVPSIDSSSVVQLVRRSPGNYTTNAMQHIARVCLQQMTLAIFSCISA